MTLRSLLKKAVPSRLILTYHFLEAKTAARYFRWPSKRMVMIGVTGTKGKTTTANYLWGVLTAAGYRCGLISTANIKIGDQESLNKFHMTMPGPFITQRMIKNMADQGCQFCIMEVTSEGIKQSRHIGIIYDIAVFTNLTPEHLASHEGSFENYKAAKQELFRFLKKSSSKKVEERDVPKTIIVNNDSPHKDDFIKFPSDQKITFGFDKGADFQAHEIKQHQDGVSFKVKNDTYRLPILGDFNVYNALPAIAVAQIFEIPTEKIHRGLEMIETIPGRMEIIDEGQPFEVIVDYAHEKESLTAALTTVRTRADLKKAKVIILLGAEGGGRDKAKRPQMGCVAAKLADYVIVSNVDPYNDEPMEIINDIAKASLEHGKETNKTLFSIENRRLGIRKALELAQPKDIVIITGKGAEQSMFLGKTKIDWDDRSVVREELKKL